MRVSGGRIVPVAKEVEITFDGQPVRALEGESLAAALTAAGKLALRRSKDGAPRGLFCGMGVCFECAVAVDGQPNIRACMTPVQDGMRVEPQDYAPRLPAGDGADEIAAAPEGFAPEQEVEVLVVGGGPAGLSAARAAARAGARVVLVDERPALGGQYFKQLARTHRFADERRMDRQFRDGRDLIAEVMALGVRVLSGASVWSAFPPREVAALIGGRSVAFRPAQLVVATGAYERGVPLPGWTLPGFMTTGAAQTLLRAYRVAPGRRVLVAGNGPLNFQVACELVAAGAEVAAVVEAARCPGPKALPHFLAALGESPDLMWDGIQFLGRLISAGVPILWGHVVVEASGAGKVETATVGAIGPDGRPRPSPRRGFEVDAVCVGYGFLPNNDLTRPLGCRHRYDATRGSLVVERNQDGESSVAGVLVAGDCGGMGGSRVAIEQGFLAGIAAARNLGRTIPASLMAEGRRCRRRLRSHERFQKALWRLFEAPLLIDHLAAPETIVCRCEGTTLAALGATLGGGTDTVGGIKRQTRAGMGRCQGRYCGPVVTRLTDAARGAATDEFSYFWPRPPIKPVPINAIVKERTP